jgi:recyclin-1
VGCFEKLLVEKFSDVFLELIAMVIDYLPVSDLMRFARTSRRMLEMVNDDTRWVQRLKNMGCWNELEARQRHEEGMKRKVEAQRAREMDEARRTAVAPSGSMNGSAPAQNKTSVTLFDANAEEEKARKSLDTLTVRTRQSTMDRGFDSSVLISNGSLPTPATAVKDPSVALKVFSRVKSIRGFARQEYSKIHGALAPFYFDLVRSRSHTDPILFRVYKDPEQQAQMLAQLKRFAQSDFAQGWNEREEKLDSMIGIFENAALREFEQGIQTQDIDGRMRRYAYVLVILNGGAAAIDSFIQNNPFMTRRESLGNPLDCIRHAMPGDVTLHPSLEFFRQLATMLNEQASIIDRVFPPTIDVLKPFVERVAEDVISEYINALFDEVHERSIEAFLKAVSGVFEQALRFAITVKPSKASKPTFSEDLKQYVTHCFEPHIDLYLQEEVDYFKRKTESEVDAWEKQLTAEEASKESFLMSNVNRQADKRDFLTSFKKVIMMPVNVVATIPSYTPFANPKPSTPTPTSNKDGLTPTPRANTPVPTERSSSPQTEVPTTELTAKAALMNSRLEGIKSLFSIEVALNLVHTAKASLERVALFVKFGGQPGEEAREQCELIFVILLQILGTRHIKPGFDKAVLHLSEYNPREIIEHNMGGVEPLVTFLELVNVGDLIQQMIDVFYAQELVSPKLSDRDDFLSPAVKEKKRFEQMLDERVAAGLNKGIDVLMDEVEYICATSQLSTDFNPGGGKAGGNQVVDLSPTETATRVVDLVSSHVGMLTGSTDKNVLDVFNQEVGVRLFTGLCKHIKRQRISVDGAIKLIRYVRETCHTLLSN